MSNAIAMVGTLAGRPAPRTSTEGKFYLADDTEELFVQNDMAWVLAATIAGGGGGGGLPAANFTPVWDASLDVMTITSDVAFFYGIGAVQIFTDQSSYLLANGQYVYDPSLPMSISYPSASAYGQEVTQIDFLAGPNSPTILGTWTGQVFTAQQFDVQYAAGPDELTITRILGAIDLTTIQSINYQGASIGAGQLQENTHYVANSPTEIVVSQASFFLNGPGNLEQLDFWDGASFVAGWAGSVALP